jgi:hypothetical protein
MLEMYDGLWPMVDAVVTRITFIPSRTLLPSFYQEGDIAEKFKQFGIPKGLKVVGMTSYKVEEWRRGILFTVRIPAKISRRRIGNERSTQRT